MPALLLILTAFACAWGAELPQTPTPAPAPAPPAGPAKPAAAPSSLAVVRAYCQRANLAWNVEGTGPFRIVWAGGTTAPMPGMVDAGVKALALIEQWTGKIAAFTPDPLTDELACWMVVLPKGAVGGLVDTLKFTDPGLAKKLGSFSMQGRVGITNPDGIKKEVALHRSAYYAAVLAIDGWFAANPARAAKAAAAPILLREGIAAEVQRLVCGDIRVTTVAYEIGDRASEGTWAKRIKQLIAGKIPSYRAVPVRDAIESSLDAMPICTYQQIWSVFCYLRDSTPRAKKGELNKLMQLFQATAGGLGAADAVAKVYGAAEPKITQAWAAWAQQQRD